MKQEQSRGADTITLTPIGYIHSDFPDKFGIPRQSGMVPSLLSRITFTKNCQNPDCFRDIESFSHLWLLWGFSKNLQKGWSPTVRPPRLGGNVHTGVFASRSPFRPNPLGISSVRLEKVELSTPEGPVLYVSGADLMDATPLYDIKPYLSFTDSHPDALASFTDAALRHRLSVHCHPSFLDPVPVEKREALLETLALDPRPAYQTDPRRVYNMDFGSFLVRFSVQGKDLYIKEIKKAKTISSDVPF